MEKASSINILLIMDTTGSMSNFLKATIQTITDIISYAKKLSKGKVEIGFLGYKDFCDNSN